MRRDHVYQEAQKYIEDARLKKSTTFDMTGLGLSELPASISRLKNLQSLDLSGNRLTKLPESISRLPNLQSLDLSGNRLTKWPESISRLPNLFSLYLPYNQLTAIPGSISQLTNLQSFVLTENRLKVLPKWIGQLKNLHSLDLQNNQLKAIPKSLGQLKNLRSLNLAHNKLTVLPESLGQLKNLRSLDLAHNKLTMLPKSLAQLNQLRSLILYSNNISDIPDFFKGLVQLESLCLSNNPINSLPNSIRNLSNLRFLGLSGARISTLPECIRDLTKLELFSLGHTILSELPYWIGELKFLKGLDLSAANAFVYLWEKRSIHWSESEAHFNPGGLEKLPESINKLQFLNELYLHGNDNLDIPAEILGPSWDEVHSTDLSKKEPARPKDILDYYFRTRGSGRALNEAKLILVGRGGVGKTCLIKRLIHGTFDANEPETQGIEIQPWMINLEVGDNVRLHIWDFGGQEILHATHQFFFTERTIYLLVLSGREGTATQDAEYWLQLIRSFGGNSPVIVVLNKSQQHPFDVNRGLLIEKYHQIVGFVRTDCQKSVDGSIAANNSPGESKDVERILQNSFSNQSKNTACPMGIEKLRDLINNVTTTLDHRKVHFPSDWFEIKERLSGMKENFVTWDHYQEICRDMGEHDSKSQKDLAGFLHTLGIALNYSDDPRLKETHVLNPQWVTEGIYSLLRAGYKQREQRKGVLSIDNLPHILCKKDYPKFSHKFLLTLMAKFNLCFPLPGQERRYLIPELLGENQPDEIKELLAASGLGFRYQYEVLPEGLLPRFIVQTQAYSQQISNLRWRTGVALKRNGCTAVVRADVRERRVDIKIIGHKRQRLELLAIIRDKFDEQHRDLKGLVVDERVPLPDEPHITVSYNFLLTLEQDREDWYRPEGSKNKVRVTDLLNGVSSFEDRIRYRPKRNISKDNTITKKHIFISYCHENEPDVRRLHDDLEKAGEKVWWDKDILGGQDWKQSIRRAMRNSYAVLLCLSPELNKRVASGVFPEIFDSIREYRQQTPGCVFLIPVKLGDCDIPDFEIDDTRTLDRLQAIDFFPASKRPDKLQVILESLQAAPNHP